MKALITSFLIVAVLSLSAQVVDYKKLPVDHRFIMCMDKPSIHFAQPVVLPFLNFKAASLEMSIASCPASKGRMPIFCALEKRMWQATNIWIKIRLE